MLDITSNREKMIRIIMSQVLDDDDEEEEEEEDILDMEEAPAVQQDALLMRFCPHDSSMLYPQVRIII